MEKLALNKDPTLFTHINKKYQDKVKFLLECAEDALAPEISAETLRHFRAIYTDTAYKCRYLHCQYHSTGFDSQARRNEHEQTHAKPLRCPFPTCAFWLRGFNSRSGLLKHNKRYH